MRFLTTIIVIHVCIQAVCSRPLSGWYDFEGSIGGVKVSLTLYPDNEGKLKGSYYYNKYETKIDLRGELDGGDLILEESINQEITGFFIGTVSERFSSIEGEWINANSAKSLPFKLNSTGYYYGSKECRYSPAFYDTTEEVEQFAAAIKKAIVDEDYNWIAENIAYPITVHLEGTKEHTIKTADEMLRYAGKIFYSEFIAYIKKQVTINMYCKTEGAMIGAGMIWFSGYFDMDTEKYSKKIIAINNADIY
ncbi:hypothetical protein [Saccharicrinis aurantiacus]|uniref:hypothetical protein n=1 Tax=Saccharicrinis aurantiacus TaxID=1849719 RepID=UPI0008380A06|nr:hypothetical protein [Saccharicrinis aurantiacus]